MSAIQAFIEKFYSTGVGVPIAGALSWVSSWVPFSLTYLSLFLIPLALFAAFALGHRRGFGLVSVAVVAVVLYGFFLLAWGLNYRRRPLAETLALGPVNIVDRALLLRQYAVSTEELRQKLPKGCPRVLDLGETDRAVYPFFRKTLESYRFPAPAYHPVKSSPAGVFSFVSTLLLKMGNSGIYGPFTGEANVTQPTAPGQLPFTLVHERAHQAGFASETEASVIAFLTLENCDDPEMRYSGRLAFWGPLSDSDKKFAGLSQGVQNDIQCGWDFWMKYRSAIERPTRLIYDYYLKAQGQKRGIKTYDDASELMIRALARAGK
ncbi:MAG: DUF3810 family protein [Deltaproteobacteria bacterium]|nr:DUF3810 family protein [Deltaproteobacteria bacterium]MBI3293368.1 DUF3810 family protein [Deltaproteobacteria bacterium]